MDEKVIKHNKFVRCSVYLQKSKFLTRNSNFLIHGLPKGTILGLDLSLQQDKLLFALQKCLDIGLQTGSDTYHPNDPQKSDFGFEYEMPVFWDLKYTHVFEAYGCKKHQTKRGTNEYSGQTEKLKILLKEMSDRLFYFHYTVKKKYEGEIRTEEYKGHSAIFIFDAWRFSDLKLRYEFSPALPMFQDLDAYFIPKPWDFYEHGERVLKDEMGINKPSRYQFRVLDWIVLYAFLNRYRQWSISPETLAHAVRLGAYLKNGKKKQAFKHIEEGLELALRMGYLTEINTTGGKSKSCYEIFPNKEVLKPKKKEENDKRAKIEYTIDEYAEDERSGLLMIPKRG